MEFLNQLISNFFTFLFIVLSLQALYLFIYAIAGKIFKTKTYKQSDNLGSFVIYIPSYKEDNVIIQTAQEALKLNYPPDKYKVVIIADSLAESTIETLKSLPLQVVEVVFEKSTKAKALNVALSKTEYNFDFALILDADNVCDADALYKLNDVLQNGYKVVQGQRVAKNTNTNFALLDAISEGINNHIFRKGHSALGLSAAIIGSGMAMSFQLFKEVMPAITAVGGFDKEMELHLLRKRIKFGYAESAIIYDEKITQKAHFESQRKRWLSAQFHYMRRYLLDGFVQLFKGNLDFFDKVIQTLLLPRILLIGLVPILSMISFLLKISPFNWLTLWIITYVAIFISVPKKYVNKQLWQAVIHLPMAFLSMFLLFFKLKGANKTFIHTPHGEISNK